MSGDLEFYERIAKLLGVSTTVEDRTPYKRIGRDGREYMPDTDSTRWGPRKPGNGRYEGRGIVRCFGETVHVAIYSPVKFTGSFGSREEALEFLSHATEAK